MITTIIACVMLALSVFIWWFCFRWLPRQPVYRYEDGAQSDKDVWRIVEASRPAPLDEQERVIRAARSAWMDQA